jgi:predicted transcriptional regulator
MSTTTDDNLLPAMRRVIEICLPGYFTPRTCRNAAMDVVALGWLIEAPSMCGMTQTELGKFLGVTKAAISKHVRQMSRRTGYRRRDMKADRHCPSYSAGAKSGWAQRVENDRSYHRAHEMLPRVMGARAWFDRLPKHIQRRALVVIGRLPTDEAIRSALVEMCRAGWRGPADLRKRIARVESRLVETEHHHAATQARVLELTEEAKVARRSWMTCNTLNAGRLQ